MGTVGCQSEAAEIFKVTNDYDRNPALLAQTLSAMGWTRLGSGSYRTAYLSPSRVVYKVQRRLAWRPRRDANESEVEIATRLRNEYLPENVYIPEVDLYYVHDEDANCFEPVVAMEYIEGEHPTNCYVDSWNGAVWCDCGLLDEETQRCPGMDRIEEMTEITVIGDIHEENVIVMEDGRFAVIDLQF